MTRGPARPTRILVGATTFADAETALGLVRFVPGGMASDLIGLLAEDLSDLMDKGTPVGRLVTFSGRVVAAPDREHLIKLMEGERRAFQASLSKLAGTLAAHWSFEARTGTLDEVIASWTIGWDMLLIGHRKLHRRPGSVAVICGPGPGQEKARGVALSLAAATGARCQVLEMQPDPTGLPASGDEPRDQGGRLVFTDINALLVHLGRTNLGALVLDLSSGPFSTTASLQEVLRVARCPIIVLGGSRQQSE